MKVSNLKGFSLGVVATVLLVTGASFYIKGGGEVAARSKLPKIKAGEPLPGNLFVELAKLINPTVVNIYTSTTPKPMRRPRQFQNRDPFFDLFEQFFGGQMPQQRPRQSLGTGFIIREDGLILTNNHVVERADIIKVQIEEGNGQEYEAEIIGRDRRTDIALIKINAKKKLPAAKLGSSKNLQVGEWVAAFGNPFGHGHSVTKGIISAMGREIGALNRFPFIQTDASINPGNSGGPLVNTRGEVIGVNSAIDARAQGIGFAIPIDEVKSILGTLEKEGRIKRGYLGVYLSDLDRSSAQTLGLKSTLGALVTQVEKKSPAAKSGLKPYDFIVKVNKTQIKSSADLMRAIADTSVGQKVKLEVMRDGKKKKLTILVGTHPDEQKAKPKSRKSYRGQKAPFELGFKVTDSNLLPKDEFDLSGLDRSRPVVTDVKVGSPSAKAGLAPGDVVLDINMKPVKRSTDVLRHLKNADVNVVRVLRHGTFLILYLRR